MTDTTPMPAGTRPLDADDFARQVESLGRELRYAREFNRSLIDASHDLVLSVDDAGLITFTNRGFLGAGATGLVGRRLDTLVEEAYRAEFAGCCAAVRDGTEGSVRVDAAGAGPLAGHWCRYALSQLRVGDSVRGLTLVISDISDINAAWDRIRSAERLVATGRMAARVAHEINNPLAGMAGAMQLIKADIPGDSPTQRYVQMVEAEIGRISNIVRQMFGLYRPEQEASRDLDLGVVVGETILFMEGEAAQRNVRIINRVTRPEPAWVQDQNLRQVLLNVLRNAIEVTPDGGEVCVTVERHGRCVDVVIEDEGPGVSQALVEQMFEPFYSTKEASRGRGLGLGLSISDALVKAMGGTISFENRPRLGARCKVCLPEAGRIQFLR